MVYWKEVEDLLSIVIPCYNEGNKIKDNIDKIKKYLQQMEYEIICVNDGSTDNTKEILSSIDSIKQIGYTTNKGKGYAVNYGLRHASGERIIFMDADLSTDMCAIDDALKRNESIVIGSRTNTNSKVTGKTFLRNL